MVFQEDSVNSAAEKETATELKEQPAVDDNVGILTSVPEGIKAEFKPAPTNQAIQDYPQINCQGRIKYRAVAPTTKSVATTFRDSTEFINGGV